MGSKVSVTASDVTVSHKGHSEMPYHRSAREFTKLKTVNFSRNGIVRFPKQLGPDLQAYPPIVDTLLELDLSSNDIETLPDEICLLVNLKKLKLEGNRLTRLPAHMPALYKLEKLYLNDNELRELPIDMANMTGLKVRKSHGFLTSTLVLFAQIIGSTRLLHNAIIYDPFIPLYHVWRLLSTDSPGLIWISFLLPLIPF